MKKITLLLSMLFAVQPILASAADSLKNSFRMSHFDNITIAEAAEKGMDIGIRLSNFLDNLERRENDAEKLADHLEKRYAHFTSAVIADISIEGYQITGDPNAPVLLTAYFSANCPMCTYILSEIYGYIHEGRLKNKVRMVVKPLGIGPGEKALIYFQERGKLWEYIGALKESGERVTDRLLRKIAEDLGEDPEKFMHELDNKELAERTYDSRVEGINLGVKATPGFAVNGKYYNSFKDPAWLADAAEYEYVRINSNND